MYLEFLGGGIPRIHELAIIPRCRPRSQIERDSFPDYGDFGRVVGWGC